MRGLRAMKIDYHKDAVYVNSTLRLPDPNFSQFFSPIFFPGDPEFKVVEKDIKVVWL